MHEAHSGSRLCGQSVSVVRGSQLVLAGTDATVSAKAAWSSWDSGRRSEETPTETITLEATSAAVQREQTEGEQTEETESRTTDEVFCMGMGAVCAERHKSPEMNSKRGERGQEPDQRATTAQPPPKQQTPKTPPKTQPKRPTNNQHQIRLMSAQCELQKVKMRGSNTGVKRGNELSSGCTQYRLSTIQ